MDTSSSLGVTTLVPAVQNQEIVRDRLHNTTFVGIDFGTSTTVASYAVLGDRNQPIKAEPIPIPQMRMDGSTLEHHLVPSVIAWYNEQLLIGVGAREARENSNLSDERTVWSSFKMDLGVDQGPQYYGSVLTKDHPVATIQTPQDAARVFFRYLNKHIRDFVDKRGLPQEIKYSISIPASFEPNQRQDLTEALQAAGIHLPKQAFIDEPNAAFLSYLTEINMGDVQGLQIPSGKPLHVMVFDFGAGTCDISILEIGQAAESFYSKNLAISRFEVLGGDNIDRQVVREVLFPQMLEQSDASKKQVRETDLEKRIVPELKPLAEELKIKASKRVGRETVGSRLPSLASSDKFIELDTAGVTLKLMRSTMRLSAPRLTFGNFQDVMCPFLDAEGSGGANEDQISIFKPVQSALSKADLDALDLDMILLVGGSSENPYVQAALREEFEAVEVEIPQDLRAHVSTGAAINSLLVNGFDLNIITPITSETIYIITREGAKETLYPAVRAGTEIPSPPKQIDALHIGQDGQTSVQIPICVGTRNKLLGTLEVKSSSEQGFDRGTPVHVTLRISDDKLLTVTAQIGDREAEAVLVHPVSNKEMTQEERNIREAEKAVNTIAAGRGGRPSVPALLELAEVCDRAGDHMRAAEILEQVQMMDESTRRETSITYQYAEAGRYDLALEWAEKAYERNEHPTTAFNLALMVRKQKNDTKRYEALLEESIEMDGEYTAALISLGNHLRRTGDEERGDELLRRAFGILERRLEQQKLSHQEARNLTQVAKYLGRDEIAKQASRQIEAARETVSSGAYDQDKLAEQRQPDQLLDN